MAAARGMTSDAVRVRARVTRGHDGGWWIPDAGLRRALDRAALATFGVRPALVRSGGSLPAARILADVAGVTPTLLGLAPAGSGSHGPDEFLDVAGWTTGVRMLVHLMAGLAETSAGGVPRSRALPIRPAAPPRSIRGATKGGHVTDIRAGLPAPDELRERVVEALVAMLAEAEHEPLCMSAVEGNGLTVVFEHDRVRCVLVVDLSQQRATLSPRELQIARLVARGATNRAIGSMLDISAWTVSTHVRRIFAKLGVSSRAEMVSALFAAPEIPEQRASPNATQAGVDEPVLGL